jgi:hypothetical protein
MPFSDQQRARLIELLQSKGWVWRDDIIWSPDEGIYFSDSHFKGYDPEYFRDLFARRYARTKDPDDLAASWAAGEVMNPEPPTPPARPIPINPISD